MIRFLIAQDSQFDTILTSPHYSKKDLVALYKFQKLKEFVGISASRSLFDMELPPARIIGALEATVENADKGDNWAQTHEKIVAWVMEHNSLKDPPTKEEILNLLRLSW
jgi:hypothetical protein